MERLRKRPDFLKAAKGRRWAMPGLVLQARFRGDDSDAPRVGFTATRKVGGAVERNRVKRRLRAAVHCTLPQRARPGFDYVLVARRGTLTRPFDEILDDLGTALDKVHSEKPGGRPGKEPRRSESVG